MKITSSAHPAEETSISTSDGGRRELRSQFIMKRQPRASDNVAVSRFGKSSHLLLLRDESGICVGGTVNKRAADELEVPHSYLEIRVVAFSLIVVDDIHGMAGVEYRTSLPQSELYLQSDALHRVLPAHCGSNKPPEFMSRILRRDIGAECRFQNLMGCQSQAEALVFCGRDSHYSSALSISGTECHPCGSAMASSGALTLAK